MKAGEWYVVIAIAVGIYATFRVIGWQNDRVAARAICEVMFTLDETGSDATKAQIAKHNELYRQKCGGDHPYKEDKP